MAIPLNGPIATLETTLGCYTKQKPSGAAWAGTAYTRTSHAARGWKQVCWMDGGPAAGVHQRRRLSHTATMAGVSVHNVLGQVSDAATNAHVHLRCRHQARSVRS
jgi:hypothetical protein